MSELLVQNSNVKFRTAKKFVDNGVGVQKQIMPNFGADKPDTFNGKTAANDGKFQVSEAAKNFGKGIVSPITSMFSSWKNFAIGAGMIVGSSALVVATGGAAAPILVAAGVGMGAVEAGVGFGKLLSAKDGDDAEKAFFNIGAGSGTVGLSVLGSKSSLRAAGKDVTGMNTGEIAKLNILKSTKANFNSLKGSFKGSKEAFTSGNWKINLELPILKHTTYKKYAKQLEAEGKKAYEQVLKDTQGMIPKEMQENLIARTKSSGSILKKLVKRTQQYGKIKSYAEAKQRCTDLVGTRLVLEDTKPNSMDALVAQMMEQVAKGDVEILELHNYHGPNKKPYFNNGHIQALQSAAKDAGKTIKIGDKSLKKSGYTTTQMKIKHKNGVTSEFQIRGKEVHSLAEVEHIPYDIRQGKDITEGIPELEELYAPIKKAAYLLDNEQEAMYSKYLVDMYDYRRSMESGMSTQHPYYPTKLDKALKIENLEKLHSEALKIKNTKKSS